MKNWKIWVMVVLALLIGCATPEADPTPTEAATGFTRKAMLDNLVNNIILPLNAEFVAQTAVLETAANTFSNEPTQTNLEALQNEWRTTSNLWQQAELYEFDRMMVLHNQIAKTPTDTEFIEDYLAREPDSVDEAFIDSIGSTTKGLPAIEYFIFSPDGNNEAVLTQLTNEPSRMQYIVATTQNLHNKAQEIEAYWLPEDKDYANTFINADGGGENLTVR